MVRPINQRSKCRLKSERTMLCGSIRADRQLIKGRQVVRADRQLDERTDGQTGRFEQIRYPRIQLLSLSENGKAKEST